MKSAIIINLDYQRHGEQTCRRIWEDIARCMEEAGFSRHYRLFMINQDRETACQKAKAAVATAEEKLAGEGIDAFDAIREFYGFEYQQENDLLALVNEIPEVTFVESDAFRSFLGAAANN